eukprot:symbB.v1.2.032137.t1/scaffold3816.1/size52752/4
MADHPFQKFLGRLSESSETLVELRVAQLFGALLGRVPDAALRQQLVAKKGPSTLVPWSVSWLAPQMIDAQAMQQQSFSRPSPKARFG